MLPTNDREIRAALHVKKLKVHQNSPDTIVVDELGLAHARVRIDVAVINGCVHGYEIKSSQDSLDRLPAQLELYGRCLGKLTIVCAPKHVTRVKRMAPSWCGIIKVEKGRRGGIGFSTIRRGRANPQIDAVHLAHLLWRAEAAELLGRCGGSTAQVRQPRKQLYAALAELLTIDQITASIREFMQARQEWRDLPAHA